MENLGVQSRFSEVARQVPIVVAASLVIALCARICIPLPFTPVPLTLASFAVVAVGLLLGGKRGFAAATLYLANGAAGMPVFSPFGPGGIAQLLGPVGGYLTAYPLVAFVAGVLVTRLGRGLMAKLVAAAIAELVLFTFGISWLMIWTHVSVSQALDFGMYPFAFGEVIKMMGAAGIANKLSLDMSER